MDVIESKTEVRLSYGPLRGEDVESVTLQDDEGPTRIRFKAGLDLGYIQVGTDFANFDEYALTALEVHAPSEHTFRHASWPVEIQLWHEPISLLRIPSLAANVSALAKRSAAASAQVDTMIGINDQLRKEMVGEDSPWTQATAWEADRIQALDWIDATKKQVVQEAANFKTETAEQLEDTERLIRQAKGLVHAQKRTYAGHQVVISLFILRTPFYAEPKLVGGYPSPVSDNETPKGSELLRWISGVLSGRGEPGSLDFRSVLDVADPGSHRDLYFYHGSLTRPPCTPNVRWLVAAQPLPALSEDLKRLLEIASVGISPIENVLSGRDTKPLGRNRKLHSARLKAEDFRSPALALSEMSSQGSLKWAFVQRYGKVFFMCASMLFFTPIIFSLARACMENMDDEKDENGRDRSLLGEDDADSEPGRRRVPFAQVNSSSSWQVNIGARGSEECDARAARMLDR